MLDGSPEVMRDVAMATNFGTQFAITGHVCTTAIRRLVTGGLSGRLTECRYCRYPAPKGRCRGNANHFFAFYILGAHWRHLVNTAEPSVCDDDAALCQITLTTCYAS